MEQRQIRKTFSRIGLGMLVLLALQQVLVYSISLLATTYFPDIAGHGWYFWVLSYAPLYLVALPISLLIFRTIPNLASDPEGGLRLSAGKLATLVLVCLGIVYPLNLLSTLLSTLVAALKGSDVINPLEEMVMGSSTWANLLFTSVIAPVMEELIFRRLVYRKMAAFGGKAYILFSAFIFALFHANIYQLLYAFVLGVLFAGVYWKTGKIGYTIALHVGVNFIGSGVSSIILRLENELILGIWGMLLLIAMATGLVIGIRWLIRNFKSFRLELGAVAVEPKKLIFLNTGVILFTIAMVVTMIAVMLM